MRLELTRRGAYAIRALTALAQAGEGGERTATGIARAMGIPRGFLPQVLADLVRAGLVSARLGRGGGYRLTRAAAEITLLDAIEAVEGDVRRRECVLRSAACGTAAEPCAVHAVFARAQDALLAELAGTTFADLAAGAPGPALAGVVGPAAPPGEGPGA